MIIIGHRGARELAPENTLQSFDAALECGVDAVEFDVRVSADGVPVINHDDHILNNNIQLKIAKIDYRQLKAAQPSLITLDQAMRKIDKKAIAWIEIKPSVNLEPVMNCLRSYLHNNWGSKNLMVASFDFKILKQLRHELPELELVVNEKWSGVRGSHRCKRLNASYIAMNQKWLWSGFIKSISRRYKLSAYALNDPVKAKKWAKHGLYGVITDDPKKYDLSFLRRPHQNG